MRATSVLKFACILVLVNKTQATWSWPDFKSISSTLSSAVDKVSNVADAAAEGAAKGLGYLLFPSIDDYDFDEPENETSSSQKEQGQENIENEDNVISVVSLKDEDKETVSVSNNEGFTSGDDDSDSSKVTSELDDDEIGSENESEVYGENMVNAIIRNETEQVDFKNESIIEETDAGDVERIYGTEFNANNVFDGNVLTYEDNPMISSQRNVKPLLTKGSFDTGREKFPASANAISKPKINPFYAKKWSYTPKARLNSKNEQREVDKVTQTQIPSPQAPLTSSSDQLMEDNVDLKESDPETASVSNLNEAIAAEPVLLSIPDNVYTVNIEQETEEDNKSSLGIIEIDLEPLNQLIEESDGESSEVDEPSSIQDSITSGNGIPTPSASETSQNSNSKQTALDNLSLTSSNEPLQPEIPKPKKMKLSERSGEFYRIVKNLPEIDYQNARAALKNIPTDTKDRFADIKDLMEIIKNNIDFAPVLEIKASNVPVTTYKDGDNIFIETLMSKWLGKSWIDIEKSNSGFDVALKENLKREAPITMQNVPSLAPKKKCEKEVLEGWLVEGLMKAYPNLAENGCDLTKNDAIGLILLSILTTNLSKDQSSKNVINRIFNELKLYVQKDSEISAFPIGDFTNLKDDNKKSELIDKLLELIDDSNDLKYSAHVAKVFLDANAQ